MHSIKQILKWPLIIAGAVVILRVIVERMGAHSAVSNILSVAVLHTVLGPLYFATRVAKNKAQHPFRMLFTLIGIYAVCTRAMILPTYWLARIFDWHESRFAGLAGPDVSPFVGFIAIPFATAAFWIAASLVVGGLIGTITLALVRR